MYGLSFSDNLWHTGPNIVEHNLIMFACFISHFIPTTIIFMYFHLYQLFDALLCLLIFGNSNFTIWNIHPPLPPVCFGLFLTNKYLVEYELFTFYLLFYINPILIGPY